MYTQGKIIRGTYFDSVALMLVAREALALPGVRDAAAVMASDENKRILASSGMDWPELAAASDTDLALGIKADTEIAAVEALAEAEAMLSKKKTSAAADSATFQPRSLDRALKEHPTANLALISIAGRYAADEAMNALRAGLHVMLFSDNVPLEAEIACKQYAAKHGLLVMGPDCGTALIGGIPLAFANVVRRGAIGLVAASGTGLQEVSSIIHQLGEGVSHAIGTGGRDIKEEVGGVTFLAGLEALKQDADTRVVALVSKPPDDSVLQKIGQAITACGKPVVAHFIGADPDSVRAMGAIPAATLEETAHIAVALAQGTDPEVSRADLAGRTCPLQATTSGRRRYVRGLFCGGTFAQEAVAILGKRLDAIETNVVQPLDDPGKARGHAIIDMGGDEYTVGRAHPMIDYSLRNRRILAEAADPEVAVILLDVVLGYGSNERPAEELAPIFKDVTNQTPPPLLLFHVCGTDLDPQGRAQVIAALQQAGGVCAPSNAAAAAWASQAIGG